jgi:uncharacterized protein
MSLQLFVGDRHVSRFRLCCLTLVGATAALFVNAGANANSALTAEGLASFSAGQYARALQDWQQAADSGDGEAALYIGLLNDLGRGAPRNAPAALRWYQRGAALGNSAAMFNVAVLYDSGNGIPRDFAAAIDWYQKAAELGMGRAAYALGLIYEEGDGVPPDRDQAVRYFRQARAVGVTAAGAHLALLGDQSRAQVTPAKAESTPAKDSSLAAFDRAQELLLGRSPQDTRQAATLLRQAAGQGDLLAAYDLAYCYEKGIGVEADRQRAYVWYSRAATSSTAAVQTAGLAGMSAIARSFSPSELAKAKSAAASKVPE